jgi:hypothetical protein
MLALAEVTLDDFPKRGLEQVTGAQAVENRCEAGDGDRQYGTAGPDDSTRLA